jgi:hypothetical protein
MGTETEYAISGKMAGKPVPPEALYDLLNDAVRGERAWVADEAGPRGSFLANGSRLYLDCGGHPEYATPECSTPLEVACYDKAGELLLATARDLAVREHAGLELTVVKNNVAGVCPEGATWGCHEAHTAWVPLETAAPQLIPHLVSRVFYAGAGCLAAQPGGSGFELSQRARHLVQLIGPETTSNRALFCTRANKSYDSAAEGWRRVHLIAKDSLRSSFGTYLTFATTGLLFLMLNERRTIGKGLALTDALSAVRAFSRDPRLQVRVPLADGRRLSAVEIQEVYLSECEQAVPGGDFPAWATEALGHWRRTLEAARDPLCLAGQLDAYTKLIIYNHRLRQAGCSWSELSQALDVLSMLRRQFQPAVIQALLAEDTSGLEQRMQLANAEAVKVADACRPGRLDRLRFAARLQAADLNYHELGGVFDQLVQSRRLHEMVERADVERAVQQPPSAGRAAVRGTFIGQNRESGWAGSWAHLYHPPSGKLVEMRDPFSDKFTLTGANKQARAGAGGSSIREIVSRFLGR